MKRSVKMVTALLFTGMLFSACGENGVTNPSDNQAGSIVSFKLTTAQSRTRAMVPSDTLVRSGIIKLIHADTTRYIALDISGNQASAIVTGIITGNWSAQVQLYDEYETLIFSGSTPFTVSANSTTQITTITIAPHSGPTLFTKPDSGDIEFSFTLPPNMIDVPGLILLNKLDNDQELQNSVIGPNLDTSSISNCFNPGKWSNGLDCRNLGTVIQGDVTIPENTIPMSDFSIEFWYTKTEPFTDSSIKTLFFIREPITHYTKNISLHIQTPWSPVSSGNTYGPFYCIKLGVRINTSNTKEVFALYNFGSLTAINNAFPLNTPVHIAFTKRNSDGRLQIFLNGTLLPTQYVSFNEPYYTADTSHIAGKSGTFPYKAYIGQYNPSIVNGPDTYNAGGTIDNLKIYDIVRDSFTIDAE